MRVCVGPQDVGENDRIAGVRFGAAGPMPIPITGNGVWIDGIHRPTGGEQRGNQEQARALDRHWDRFIQAFATFSEHTGQLGEASGTNTDPPLRQNIARLINDSYVVVVFGPIDPTRQTHVDLPLVSNTVSVDWAPAA
jgi:hypothetical protein